MLKLPEKYAIGIIYTYHIYGMIYIMLNLMLPYWFMSLGLYMGFKVLFNYRKCTISYLECKIRGVKREDGYLNCLLDGLVNLRNNDVYYYYILVLVGLFSYYHFIFKKGTLNF